MNFDALAAAWAPRLLSILRIMAGLLLMQHGTAKHLKFPFVQSMAKLATTSLPGIAGILELVGGVLLVIGLFTRTTAFILSGLTAVAYFIAHAPRGFYPDPEWRRTGGPLLLRFPLYRGGRSRPVEPRRALRKK